MCSTPAAQAIEGAQSLDDILRLASPSGFPAEDKEMKNQSVAAPYKARDRNLYIIDPLCVMNLCSVGAAA